MIGNDENCFFSCVQAIVPLPPMLIVRDKGGGSHSVLWSDANTFNTSVRSFKSLSRLPTESAAVPAALSLTGASRRFDTSDTSPGLASGTWPPPPLPLFTSPPTSHTELPTSQLATLCCTHHSCINGTCVFLQIAGSIAYGNSRGEGTGNRCC